MKPSIHSLAHQTMQEWVLEQGEKKFRLFVNCSGLKKS
ncbi:ribosomal RNA large subunit methyltransferase N [Streptococcus pneumoniae]|nr:ribosomal RNA large subunit methyltransferase N [Streptococcus pneumoniae]